MTRYLVTGGAGFIGSHIVDALVDAGHEVRVIDNLDTGQRSNLEHHDPGTASSKVELVIDDIRDLAAVRRAISGCAGVFHEAALPSVPRSVEDPVSCHEVNVTGTLNVMLAARDAGAKVVYAGSSSCYGDAATLPKREDMLVAPQSPYAAAKVAGEYYLGCFARVYGMQTVTLRYFNVFGPRQRADSPYSGVIAKFCMGALAGDTCTVEGDGEQSRDFTYVGDVARGNLLAMERECPPGAVINLAGGTRYSLLDLLSSLEGIVGHDVGRVFAAPRAGDVKHSQADATRARDLLGFDVEVPFEDGLRRTIEWYESST